MVFALLSYLTWINPINAAQWASSDVLSEISQVLSTKKDEIPNKIQKFYLEWNEAIEKLKQVEKYLSKDYTDNLVKNSRVFENSKLITATFSNLDQKDIQNISSNVMKYSDNTITLFFNESDNGTAVTGMVDSTAAKLTNFNMGDFIKEETAYFMGKGGGKKDYGQGFIDKENAETSVVKEHFQKKLFEEE